MSETPVTPTPDQTVVEGVVLESSEIPSPPETPQPTRYKKIKLALAAATAVAAVSAVAYFKSRKAKESEESEETDEFPSDQFLLDAMNEAVAKQESADTETPKSE